MLLLALMFACSGDPSDTDADDTAGSDSDTDSEDTDTGSDAIAPEYSGGDCPALTDGRNSGFLSGSDDREFIVALPDDPVGAPVIFAWHWLGGTASQIMSVMGLEAFARSKGVIIIAPDSLASSPFEWAFTSGETGNVDGQFFEDMLSCASNEWEVDLDRVWATGMSAGGLWTSWLTLHKSEWLAATAPLSGGTSAEGYITPDAKIPVAITWGGPSDTYGSGAGTVYFEELSQYLSTALQADGHFVVECVHDLGHTLPPDATNLVWGFLSAHPRGATPSMPGTMPDICTIAGE